MYYIIMSHKPKPTDEQQGIAACMNCGSEAITGVVAATDIRYSGPRHVSPRYRCRECEYYGVPVLFDTEKERLKYEEFRKNRKHDLPSVFEANPTKKEKYAVANRYLNLVGGVAFFIIGLAYMFQHELLMGFMFYGASFFFLVLAVSISRNTD